MPKSLLRLIALPLAFALAADPTAASVFSAPSQACTRFVPSRMNEEALAAKALFLLHSWNPLRRSEAIQTIEPETVYVPSAGDTPEESLARLLKHAPVRLAIEHAVGQTLSPEIFDRITAEPKHNTDEANQRDMFAYRLTIPVPEGSTTVFLKWKDMESRYQLEADLHLEEFTKETLRKILAYPNAEELPRVYGSFDMDGQAFLRVPLRERLYWIVEEEMKGKRFDQKLVDLTGEKLRVKDHHVALTNFPKLSLRERRQVEPWIAEIVRMSASLFIREGIVNMDVRVDNFITQEAPAGVRHAWLIDRSWLLPADNAEEFMGYMVGMPLDVGRAVRQGIKQAIDQWWAPDQKLNPEQEKRLDDLVKAYVLRFLRNLNPEELKQLTRDINWLHETNRARKAIDTLLLPALEVNSRDSILFGFLSTFYLRTGQTKEAIEAALQGVILRPLRPEPHGILGNAYAKDGQLEKAIPEWEEEARLNPSNGVVRSRLAEAYLKLEDPQKALEHMEYAVKKISPTNSYWNELLIICKSKLNERRGHRTALEIPVPRAPIAHGLKRLEALRVADEILDGKDRALYGSGVRDLIAAIYDQPGEAILFTGRSLLDNGLYYLQGEGEKIRIFHAREVGIKADVFISKKGIQVKTDDPRLAHLEELLTDILNRSAGLNFAGVVKGLKKHYGLSERDGVIRFIMEFGPHPVYAEVLPQAARGDPLIVRFDDSLVEGGGLPEDIPTLTDVWRILLTKEFVSLQYGRNQHEAYYRFAIAIVSQIGVAAVKTALAFFGAGTEHLTKIFTDFLFLAELPPMKQANFMKKQKRRLRLGVDWFLWMIERWLPGIEKLTAFAVPVWRRSFIKTVFAGNQSKTDMPERAAFDYLVGLPPLELKTLFDEEELQIKNQSPAVWLKIDGFIGDYPQKKRREVRWAVRDLLIPVRFAAILRQEAESRVFKIAPGDPRRLEIYKFWADILIRDLNVWGNLNADAKWILIETLGTIAEKGYSDPGRSHQVFWLVWPQLQNGSPAWVAEFFAYFLKEFGDRDAVSRFLIGRHFEIGNSEPFQKMFDPLIVEAAGNNPYHVLARLMELRALSFSAVDVAWIEGLIMQIIENQNASAAVNIFLRWIRQLSLYKNPDVPYVSHQAVIRNLWFDSSTQFLTNAEMIMYMENLIVKIAAKSPELMGKVEHHLNSKGIDITKVLFEGLRDRVRRIKQNPTPVPLVPPQVLQQAA